MNRAIEMLREQQAKVTARGPQWMVAEQLIDICEHEPACADILAKDLENDGMGIVEAEKKIKAFADAHRNKSSRFSCVTPIEADRILREFYGLPVQGGTASEPESGMVDLDSFF